MPQNPEVRRKYRSSEKYKRVSKAYRLLNRDKMAQYMRDHKEELNRRRRERYHSDPEFKRKRLSQNMKRKFGVTLEEYDEQILVQAGHCLACGGKLNLQGRRNPWDHDHTTGRLRGIIHKSCNIAIGEAGDNPETLRRLASYIELCREFGIQASYLTQPETTIPK